MSDDVYQRLSIQIPKGDYESFARKVPHGQRAEAIRHVMLMIDTAIEEHGPVMLGALMLNQVQLALIPTDDGKNLTEPSDDG